MASQEAEAMIKISKRFEQWLEKEVNRLEKADNKLDAMTAEQTMRCCDHHAVHEAEVSAARNEAVNIWNKYLEITKQEATLNERLD